jgi:hypothetical protein
MKFGYVFTNKMKFLLLDTNQDQITIQKLIKEKNWEKQVELKV